MVAKRQVSENSTGKNSADLTAFEVAYALLRIAGYSGNRHLAHRLQEAAFSLVAAVAERDLSRYLSCLHSVESYLRLGEELGVVHSANTPLVLSRLQAILPMIQAKSESEVPAVLDIWPESKDVGGAVVASARQQASATVRKVQKPEPSKREDQKERNIPEAPVKETDSATLQRQTAILELIRQRSNCRMKDIQEELPDVSERTLRYDIHALIERGEVERIGAGGPFSYYKAKEQIVGKLPGVTESKGAFILPL